MNLNETLNFAWIASALLIIIFLLMYIAFGKNKRSSKSR